MKTPEQMAEEWANDLDPRDVPRGYAFACEGFLAGYKAGQEHPFQFQTKMWVDPIGPQNQWISVKERLPEEGDWVVTDSFDCCQRTKPPSSKFESMFVWRTTFNHYLKADAIKWWMPLPELPEAPKGEG